MQNIDRLDAWARSIWEQSGSMLGLTHHDSMIGITCFIRGDTARAEHCLTTAMKLAETVDSGSSPLVAMPALLLANVLYEKNDVDAAEQLIETYGAIGEKQGMVDHLLAYYLTKARMLISRDELQEGEKVLEAGRLASERAGFERLRLWIELEGFTLHSRSDIVEVAQRFLATEHSVSLNAAMKPGTNAESRHEALALAWAKAQCVLGNCTEAIRVLQRWVAFTEIRGVLWSEVRLRIALSLAFAEDDREGEALRCLREAVRKAAKPRYIRSFVEAGNVIDLLLRKLFQGADESMGSVASFGLELIEACAEHGSVADEATPPAASGEVSCLPKQLNTKESEVLRLVALGLSNIEIGKRLGLTEPSVKWYLQRLFEKLDVRRRTKAVLKARKYGILPP